MCILVYLDFLHNCFHYLTIIYHLKDPKYEAQRHSPYRAVNTFQLDYKNQSIYDVSGTSRYLSDKCKTHK
jgi:hypothetical protein